MSNSTTTATCTYTAKLTKKQEAQIHALAAECDVEAVICHGQAGSGQCMCGWGCDRDQCSVCNGWFIVDYPTVDNNDWRDGDGKRLQEGLAKIIE